MLYRKFGKTGLDVSALGFGCMRLPLARADAKFHDDDGEIDELKATEILHKAIEDGVNYVDTAYSYHVGNSESFLGQALKNGYREKVYLATKLPSWLVLHKKLLIASNADSARNHVHRAFRYERS
jgi:uncharacterized protein